MKQYILIALAFAMAIPTLASAQNPIGPWYGGGYAREEYQPYAQCYNMDSMYCEQIRKRLDRQFRTEEEWGYFKIKNIPGRFAERIQVFIVLATGERKYVVGADQARNWWHNAQPIPVDIKGLEFDYVGPDYTASVVFPAFIRPAYIRNSQTLISLTENHFFNAQFMTGHLQHQRIENADGSITEFVRTKTGEFTTRNQ